MVSWMVGFVDSSMDSWIVVRPRILNPESDKTLARLLSSSSVSAPAEVAEPEWEQRRFTWILFASVVQSRLTNTKPICKRDSNFWSQHGGGI